MSAFDEQRFSRQTRLPEIGIEGQRRLFEATIGVVGCGALGSVAAELLTRAGVGRLLLIDRDFVQWSNLQRQLLYTERDARLGIAKADAAARRLHRIRRSARLEPVVADLHAGNILEILEPADLWIDGSDNYELRLLLNDAALELRRPWVHGGCVGTGGQVAAFWPGRTACFRCLVDAPPPPGAAATCDTAGVLGPATAAIASLQVAQALRILTHAAEATESVLQTADVWNLKFRALPLGLIKRPDCPACVGGERHYLQAPAAQGAVLLCGQNAVQFAGGGGQLDLRQLALRWEGLGTVQTNRFFVRLEQPPLRVTVFRDARAIVEGTAEVATARSVYHQLLGG